MIWSNIKEAKNSKQDLNVVWLDLANAYGSVPHNIIQESMNFFHVPEKLKHLLKTYFQKFQFRFTLKEYVTQFISLDKGIAMGCAISPILFVMVIEMVLRGTEKYVSAEKVNIRAFMDDLTIIEEDIEATQKMLDRLSELIGWTKMAFKPKKSRALSLKKGKICDTIFKISGEEIPTVRENSVKSLGRWYGIPLTDRHKGVEIQKEAEDGLSKIDKSLLPGKFKVWCVQFGLLPRLLWPITIHEVALSRVETIEQKISKMIRKWLGVAKMFCGPLFKECKIAASCHINSRRI